MTVLGEIGFLFLTGCSGSSRHRLSMGDIAAAGSVCPVPLRESAEQAGLYQTGEAVVTAEPSGAGVPLADAHGVGVDCTATDPMGAEFDLTVVAVRKGSAVSLLLPDLSVAAQVSESQLDGVVRAAATTRPGSLVALPGVGSAALGIVKLDGAQSAAFLLTAGSLVRTVLDKVASRPASNIG